MDERHTPLPWRVHVSVVDGSAQLCRNTHGDALGFIKLASPWRENAWADDDEAKANAALIVHSVNTLPLLVEALLMISKIATERYEGSDKLRADDARQFRRIADMADDAAALASQVGK